MNSIVPIRTGTEVATTAVSDALTRYAEIFAPQHIIGEMLRFSKGDWYAGRGTDKKNCEEPTVKRFFKKNATRNKTQWVREFFPNCVGCLEFDHS